MESGEVRLVASATGVGGGGPESDTLRGLYLVSCRISNEVRGINRVVYDVSSNLPATIEWK